MADMWICASCVAEMSSRDGGERKPQDQVEEEEDDFYDCQEISDLREEKAKKETHQEVGGSQDFHMKTDTITSRTDYTDCETGALHKEEQGDEPQEDPDLKEDKTRGVEFDDDYLKEVEKELTEEEKEVTLLPEFRSYSRSS